MKRNMRGAKIEEHISNENFESHFTKIKKVGRVERGRAESTNQQKQKPSHIEAKAMRRACIEARTIGTKRHRQAQRKERAKRGARRGRDEARKGEEQTENRRLQRSRRNKEPMRVGCNIISFHFLLGMLRFGVEHAPPFALFAFDLFSFWVPGGGQL